MEEDFPAQIERIAGKQDSGNPASQACLHAKLSTPISYYYIAWLASTQGQLCDILNSAWLNRFAPEANGTTVTIIQTYTQADLAAVDETCGTYGDITLTVNGNGYRPGYTDLQGSYNGDWEGQLLDDNKAPMPGSYPRLKEGVERFLITDINNPAGAAKAQSSIFVMFDAFSSGRTNRTEYGGNDSGVLRYNHIPGGANVLYLDGHAEFVKQDAKAPMLVNIFNDPNYFLAGLPWTPNIPFYLKVMCDVGGMG